MDSSNNWVPVAALIVSGLSFVVAGLAYLNNRANQAWTRRRFAEEQARGITINIEDRWVTTDPGSKMLASWAVQIRNDSNRPVHVESVEFAWDEPWDSLIARGDLGLRTESLDVGPNGFDLPPENVWRNSRDIHRQEVPDFVVLEYQDESGISWRRKSDTRELQQVTPVLRWWQMASQWLTRHIPGFHAIFIRPMERRAIRSARRKGPNRVPLSLRYCRWVWGYWGAGELDPWLRPNGAPRLWGYVEMPLKEDEDSDHQGQATS